MTVGEAISVLSATISTGAILFAGGRWKGQVSARLDALTEQVKKTNGSVTDINAHGCLIRREAIARDEAKEAARAIERRGS